MTLFDLARSHSSLQCGNRSRACITVCWQLIGGPDKKKNAQRHGATVPLTAHLSRDREVTRRVQIRPVDYRLLSCLHHPMKFECQ